MTHVNKMLYNNLTGYGHVVQLVCVSSVGDVANMFAKWSLFLELSLPGAKLPGSESSKERKFQGTKALPGTKVLRSESSIIQQDFLLFAIQTRV